MLTLSPSSTYIFSILPPTPKDDFASSATSILPLPLMLTVKSPPTTSTSCGPVSSWSPPPKGLQAAAPTRTRANKTDTICQAFTLKPPYQKERLHISSFPPCHLACCLLFFMLLFPAFHQDRQFLLKKGIHVAHLLQPLSSQDSLALH